MIEARNLTKRYGRNLAVDNISFNVRQGEIVGFLGPNGAGKSTTMNILTGYLSATEGTVRVAGKDILEFPEEVKKQIGYLPEHPPLYPEMTVEDFLIFVGEIKQLSMRTIRSQLEAVARKDDILALGRRLESCLVLD